MNVSPSNPNSNRLGAGVTDADVNSAIETSGYPLQTVISNQLRESFGVQEEWCYVDRDSNELRTIDILAGKMLYDFDKEQPRVRPCLNLIIECKQSALPYVFFLSPSRHWLPEFPVLVGLASNKIEITTDDSPSTWTLPILSVLGLDFHPFIDGPACCCTFSKCERKGSNLVLSGSEPYNSLVLPIVKAVQHFQITEAPPPTAWYFDCHLTIGIGVLDAPMVGVNVGHSSNECTLLPWVRVLRHEYLRDRERYDRSRLLVIDAVHKDFFAQYLNDHVRPYEEVFSSLVLKHQKVLVSGKAFASGMERLDLQNIESRLRQRTSRAKVSRTRATLKNIVDLLSGRRKPFQ